MLRRLQKHLSGNLKGRSRILDQSQNASSFIGPIWTLKKYGNHPDHPRFRPLSPARLPCNISPKLMFLRCTSFEKAISGVKFPNFGRLVTSVKDVSCIKLHLALLFDSLLLSFIVLLSHSHRRTLSKREKSFWTPFWNTLGKCNTVVQHLHERKMFKKQCVTSMQSSNYHFYNSTIEPQ